MNSPAVENELASYVEHHADRLRYVLIVFVRWV